MGMPAAVDGVAWVVTADTLPSAFVLRSEKLPALVSKRAK